MSWPPLFLNVEATYEALQRDLHISKSTAHESVRRLQGAGSSPFLGDDVGGASR